MNRPKPYLIAVILALVMSGVYAIHQSVFDIFLVVGIGLFGYLMRWLRLPVLPLVLGLVLGYLVESNYRRSLLISGDDASIFFTDKVSLTLLVLAALLSGYSLWKEFSDAKARRRAA